MSAVTGKVFLVGAGPGDLGLVTRRAMEVIQLADVVIYDALVNPALLKWAPTTAELVYGGKRRRQHAIPQTELSRLLLAKAKEGKQVVRLKGGDPYTFGRGGEEAEELARHGIDFEIVSGVSAVHAVPAYAGIPVTHREMGSGYVLVTGHEDPNEKLNPALWEQLATLPLTKVIMMGLLQLDAICKKLIASGMDPATPAAMIQWGTLGRQKTVTGTVSSLADQVAKAQLGAPAVIVLGEVVNLRHSLNWFERRPLFGRRVIVTRAAAQSCEGIEQLQKLGAEIIEWPMVRFDAPTERLPLVEALTALHGYDWLIFTSANGVRHFFDYFLKSFSDLRDIGGLKIAAVGSATAEAIKAFHLNVDLMPAQSNAEAIAQALNSFETLENLRILLMRAERANLELPRQLEELGAIVDDVACYRTVDDKILSASELESIKRQGADWILFTSGSTARHLNDQIPLKELSEAIPGVRVASLGPQTSKVIRALSGSVDVEAQSQSMQDLIEALVKFEGVSHK